MENAISMSILELLQQRKVCSQLRYCLPKECSDREQNHGSTVKTGLLCFDKRKALQTYKLHPSQKKKKEKGEKKEKVYLMRCLKMSERKPLSKKLNVAKNGKKQ